MSEHVVLVICIYKVGSVVTDSCQNGCVDATLNTLFTDSSSSCGRQADSHHAIPRTATASEGLGRNKQQKTDAVE
jgi:hypothetical protein